MPALETFERRPRRSQPRVGPNANTGNYLCGSARKRTTFQSQPEKKAREPERSAPPQGTEERVRKRATRRPCRHQCLITNVARLALLGGCVDRMRGASCATLVVVYRFARRVYGRHRIKGTVNNSYNEVFALFEVFHNAFCSAIGNTSYPPLKY